MHSECHSLCRPRHSVYLQSLINPITYVNPGIPSYPSVKSSLLLPLLLPITFAPSYLPLPVAPLPFSPSPLLSPLLHCHLPLPVAVSHSPHPSFLSTLPTALLLNIQGEGGVYIVHLSLNPWGYQTIKMVIYNYNLTELNCGLIYYNVIHWVKS